MRHVSELMTPNPLCVTPSTSVAECARLFTQEGIRHLPVVDGGRALVGMVTEHALFRRGALLGAHDELWVSFDPDDPIERAEQIVEAVALQVRPEEPLRELLERWASTRQDVAIVVDALSRVVGILTEHDGVRLAAAILPSTLRIDAGSSSPVYAVESSARAIEAFVLMEQRGIRHVLVVTGGLLVGVVSYRDLVADDVHSGRDLPVEHVVRALEVRAVPDGASLRAAAELMAKHKVGCLPVVAPDRRPLGVVTRRDVIAALAAVLEEGEG